MIRRRWKEIGARFRLKSAGFVLSEYIKLYVVLFEWEKSKEEWSYLAAKHWPRGSTWVSKRKFATDEALSLVSENNKENWARWIGKIITNGRWWQKVSCPLCLLIYHPECSKSDSHYYRQICTRELDGRKHDWQLPVSPSEATYREGHSYEKVSCKRS